ncbi:MAG: hypothetical protein WBY88_12870 [Desulfosarcina sp.]
MDISHGRVFHGRAINDRKDGSELMMQWKIALSHNKKNETTHRKRDDLLAQVERYQAALNNL